MKFKPGDIIKCKGEHFTEREILPDKANCEHRYRTRFLEDDSIVLDDVKIIDDNYRLKKKKKAKRNLVQTG